MPTHRFLIGQDVRLRPAISRNVPGGTYEIIRQLPHNNGELEYRVKGIKEPHERVVLESELERL